MTSPQLESSSFIGAYAVIPHFVIFDNELDRGCVQLFALLSMMSGQKGNCWPTNKFLIDKLQTSEATIKRWLSQLKEKNYLIVEIEKIGIQTTRIIWLPEFHKRHSKNSYDSSLMSPGGATHEPSPLYIEEKENIKTNPLPPKGEASTEAKEIASFLLEKIKAHKPDLKEPNMKSWAIEIERMIRLDKRTPDKIKAIITWATTDSFWRACILSAAKLREKFDQLDSKMNTPLQKQSSPRGKESIKEKILQNFKKGNLYNGAECHHDEFGLGFTRGNKQKQLRWDSYNLKEDFENLLRSFDIVGFKL